MAPVLRVSLSNPFLIQWNLIGDKEAGEVVSALTKLVDVRTKAKELNVTLGKTLSFGINECTKLCSDKKASAVIIVKSPEMSSATQYVQVLCANSKVPSIAIGIPIPQLAEFPKHINVITLTIPEAQTEAAATSSHAAYAKAMADLIELVVKLSSTKIPTVPFMLPRRSELLPLNLKIQEMPSKVSKNKIPKGEKSNKAERLTLRRAAREGLRAEKEKQKQERRAQLAAIEAADQIEGGKVESKSGKSEKKKDKKDDKKSSSKDKKKSDKKSSK